MSGRAKAPARETTKLSAETLAKYRIWSKQSGRFISALLTEALEFGLEKRSEIERRFRNRVKGEGQ